MKLHISVFCHNSPHDGKIKDLMTKYAIVDELVERKARQYIAGFIAFIPRNWSSYFKLPATKQMHWAKTTRTSLELLLLGV